MTANRETSAELDAGEIVEELDQVGQISAIGRHCVRGQLPLVREMPQIVVNRGAGAGIRPRVGLEVGLWVGPGPHRCLSRRLDRV